MVDAAVVVGDVGTVSEMVALEFLESSHFSQPALVGGIFDSLLTEDAVVFEVVVDLAVVVNLRVIAGGGEGIAIVSMQHIT